MAFISVIESENMEVDDKVEDIKQSDSLQENQKMKVISKRYMTSCLRKVLN